MDPLAGPVFRAISAGPGVPRDRFKGRVHSVFASAANLSLPGDLLITLLTAGSANLPRGVRLDTPPGFSFEQYLRVGIASTCRAGLVRFSGSAFAVDLREAILWQSDLKTLSVDWGRASTRTGWQLTLAELSQHPGAQAGIAGAAFDLGHAADDPSTLVRLARAPVHALIDAARRLDAAKSAEAAAKLVGLGPGLTPSGDDFLVGFMAGLWACAAGDPYKTAYVDALGSAITRLAARTTDVSRAYLFDAARGQASETIIALAAAIRDGSEVDVRLAAQPALGVGSASGADGVAGVLCGIRAWGSADG